MLFGGNIRILGHLWKDLGKQNSADSISQLLDYDRACPVEKLLDNDHTLTELRNNNQKLIKYFNHEKVLELLHYIVIEPEQDSTYKRGHRYPFVASDLFGVQQNSILDAFFKETEVKIPIERQKSDVTKGKHFFQSSEYNEDEEGLTFGQLGKLTVDSEEVILKQKVQEQQKRELATNAEQDSLEVTIPSPLTLDDDQDEAQSGDDDEVLCNQQLDDPGMQSQKELPNQNSVQNESQELLVVQQPIIPQKFISSEEESHSEVQEEQINKNETQQQNYGQKKDLEPQADESQKKGQELRKENQQYQDDKQKQADEQIQEPVPNPPAQQSLPLLEDIQNEQQQEKLKYDLRPITFSADDQEQKLTTVTASTQADTEDEKFDIVIKCQCLQLLFSFLSDTQKQLNPVLCGYFSRIVNSLLNRRLKQLAEYLFSHFNILQNMVSHLESRSIYELVIRVLKIDESNFDGKEIQVDIYKSNMISCLIQQLSSNNSKWENLNSSQVLCEIAQNSKLWSIICSNTEFLKIIITNVINPGSTSSLHSSLKVFGSMLNVLGKWKTCWQKVLFSMQQADYNNAMKCIKAINDLQIQFRDNYDYQYEADDDRVQLEQETNKKYIKIDQVFEKIFELYDEDNHSTQLISCSYGRNIIPFGKTRLLVSRVLKSAIQIQSSYITKAVINSRILQKMMSYVQIYEWNNMLHVIADNIFSFILSGTQIINLDTTYKLKRHLLFELNFVGWLAVLSSVPRFQFDSSRKLRTGYMPFVHKLSNQLINQMKTNQEIQNLVNENQSFLAYKNGDLQMMNEINSRPLGGLKTGQSKQQEKVNHSLLQLQYQEQSQEQNEDFNVSFSVDDIYKQYNELSARYNSNRSSSASSACSQQDAGALEDQQQEEDEELLELESQELEESYEQGKDFLQESPVKKENQHEFEEDLNENLNKCSVKLGTQDVQDNEQDIYEYEAYQKRFTETMKNITSQDDEQQEEEDLKQQEDQDDQQLTALFMEKKLMKDRGKKNIRLRYQEQYQEDEKSYQEEEEDMNDRDQETDELFKYAEQVSQNLNDSFESKKKISLNPFQSPNKQEFVSDQVKSMSFGEKKLHFQLQPSSPEKNTQFYSNNFWKVDINQNYDINQLLKDFI